MVKREKAVPVCTCSGQKGGLFGKIHSPFCEIRAKEVIVNFVTVEMRGRLCQFPEDLFEVVPEPWRK